MPFSERLEKPWGEARRSRDDLYAHGPRSRGGHADDEVTGEYGLRAARQYEPSSG